MQTYPPGTRIGQYEIASLPMMGGMGVVYFALDHGNDGRPVALKTFRPELLPDRAARDRFLREGTAWIELGNHPHIVRCYKVEYYDPTAFLVLELIAKEQNMPDASLRSWLIPGHPLPLEQALLFALQIARGMQYATEKISGFVHRDLKPENILVGADKLPGTNINRLRVTDFGLLKTIASGDMPAKANADEELRPNQVQFTRGVGTPLYMAPEQWKGEPVGVFTDIYAFGCILYEMLTGDPAAEGKTITELQTSHCAGILRTFPSKISSELSDMVLKCLVINPSQRFDNWMDLITGLEQNYFREGGQPILQDLYSEELRRDEQIQSGWSYIAIGRSYLDIGNAKTATRYFEQALKLMRDNDYQRGEGFAQFSLGNVYLILGKVQRAIECFEQSLIIIRELGDSTNQALILTGLGAAYKDLGNARLAIDYYKEALTIAREYDDLQSAGSVLGNLGLAYSALGDIQQAIDYHQQSLVIARARGDRRDAGMALGNLGSAFLTRGDISQAIDCFEHALIIRKEIGDRRGEGADLGNLGNVHLVIGDIPRAIDYIKQALIIDREIGEQLAESSDLNNLGAAYMRLSDIQKAVVYFEEGLNISRRIGNLRGVGKALGNLGGAYYELGNMQRAIDFSREGLQVGKEIGDIEAIGMLSANLGMSLARIGNITEAIPVLEQAIQYAKQVGNPTHARRMEEVLARVKSGNVPQANPLQAALELFERASSPRDMLAAVAQYPIMLHDEFIQLIENVIAEKIPPNLRPYFEERLATLRQIAAQK